MIVQPTSTNPRGQLGRALRVAGLVLPPVLLVAIVAAGLAGIAEEPPRSPSIPPATGDAETGVQDPVAEVGFPGAAAGLAVRTIEEAEPLLARADGAPIAVAGWISSFEADPACETATGDTRGVRSPLCRRTLRLEAGPTGAGTQAHLHVDVAPGVRLPPPFEWPGAEHADPVPVVLVGRAATPDADCTQSTRGCGERLRADLVTWAADAPYTPGVIFDAGLEVPPPAIAFRRQAAAEGLASGGRGTVLVSAVIRQSTVAAVDPEAAAVLGRSPRPAGLVWYVRSLETIYGSARFLPGDHPAWVRWVLLDEETGAPIAAGVSDQPEAVATAGWPSGSPRDAASLRVRSIPAILAAVAAGRGDRVVALRGYLRAWADPRACDHPVPGLPANGCLRQAILADSPWASGPAPASPPAASVRAVVPPGVTVPEAAVDIEGGPTEALPVVVVARLGTSPAGCTPDRSGCWTPLTIERVTWAAGARLALGRTVARSLSVSPDDPVGADPAAAAGELVGPLTALLRVVLVDEEDLGAVDARAARAVHAAGGHRGPVWYLRGIEAPDDPLLDPPNSRPPSTVRWAVVDPRTGRVLARSAG